jgi:hypothetical protein
MTIHSVEEAISILASIQDEVHNGTEALQYALRRDGRRVTDRTREAADFVLWHVLPELEQAAGAIRVLLEPGPAPRPWPDGSAVRPRSSGMVP